MGVGRREGGRVLQEFGEEVAEVVGGEPGDLGVRRQGLDGDPLVPLDLADGRARHVDQRDRPGVAVAVLGAREDEHVLAVAAHDRGHVIQLEQGGQALRVLLALLQALDDAELPLDQSEGAQGEVDEGVVDRVPQLLQLGGQLGGPRLEFGPLGDEGLPARDQLGALPGKALDASGDVLVQGGEPAVQGVHRPYDLGELVVAAGVADRFGALGVLGEARGADAQDGERLGEGAGDGGGDADGEQEAAAEQGDAQFEGGDVVVAEALQVLDLAGGQGGLDAAQPVDAGGERGLQLLGADPALRLRELGTVGEAGEVLLRVVDLGSGDGGGELVTGLRVRRLVEVGQCGQLPDAGLLGGGAQLVAFAAGPGVALVLGRHGQPGEGVRPGLRLGARHGERGEEEPAGGGGLFGRAAEGERGPGGVGGARRGLLRQFGGDAVQLGDDVGVRLVRLQGRALAGQRVTAQRGDRREVAAQGRGGRLVDLVDLLVDPGGAGGAVLRAGAVVGLLVPAVGDVRGDGVTFVGEGVREGDRLLVQLREGDQPLGLGQIGGGPEHGGGARRQDDDADDRDTGDQSAAHPHGPLVRAGLRRRHPGTVARRALAPRPLLLHRCSQS